MLKNDIKKNFEELCARLIDNQIYHRFALSLLKDSFFKAKDYMDFEYTNKKHLAGICKIRVNPSMRSIFDADVNIQNKLPESLDFVAYLTDDALESAKFELVCKLLNDSYTPKILYRVIAQVDMSELAINVEWIKNFLDTALASNPKRLDSQFLMALQEWVGDEQEYISLVDLINFPKINISPLAIAFFKKAIGFNIADLNYFDLKRAISIDEKKRFAFTSIPKYPYFDFDTSEAFYIPKERDITELANKILERGITDRPKGYYSNALCSLLGERISAPITHALIQNQTTKQPNNQIHLFQVSR